MVDLSDTVTLRATFFPSYQYPLIEPESFNKVSKRLNTQHCHGSCVMHSAVLKGNSLNSQHAHAQYGLLKLKMCLCFLTPKGEGVNLILIERDSTLNPQNMCVGQKYEVWYHS